MFGNRAIYFCSNVRLALVEQQHGAHLIGQLRTYFESSEMESCLVVRMYPFVARLLDAASAIELTCCSRPLLRGH
jgi:hypothetical protein